MWNMKKIPYKNAIESARRKPLKDLTVEELEVHCRKLQRELMFGIATTAVLLAVLFACGYGIYHCLMK